MSAPTDEHAGRDQPGAPGSEPADGAIVAVVYRRYVGTGFFTVVWQRADEQHGKTRGDWWEIRSPFGRCPRCRTTQDMDRRGPTLWGEVAGYDDPEPYAEKIHVLHEGGPTAPELT